jgi:hypothetical protein
MEVSSKLMEFCSCSLLLELGFLDHSFPGVFIQLPSDLFIFGLDMLKVAFSSIKVVFIFSAVKSTIVFLYYFGLLIEEFTLFVLHDFLSLIHKLATANITSPDALNFQCCFLFILKLPFDSEHSPVFLDHERC